MPREKRSSARGWGYHKGGGARFRTLGAWVVLGGHERSLNPSRPPFILPSYLPFPSLVSVLASLFSDLLLFFFLFSVLCSAPPYYTMARYVMFFRFFLGVFSYSA